MDIYIHAARPCTLGDTPPLELFMPLQRTQSVANEVIAVKTVPDLDGFDIDAAVRFQPLDKGSTRVTLDFEHVVICASWCCVWYTLQRW